MQDETSGSKQVPADEQLAFLRAVYESADIGMCVTDAQRRFVLVNEAYVRTYGYRRDELIGEPFTKVLPPGIHEEAARIHDEFIAGADKSAGEWQVVRKDGEVRTVMVTAGRVELPDGRRFKVTTVHDVSAERTTEARLAYLSDVIARTEHGLILTDAAGLVTWVNEGTERITGFTLDEMKGHKPGDLLQGEGTDRNTVAHMRTGLAAREGFQVEVLNYTKSGSEYWLHIACSPVLDRQGRLEGFLALQTDFTERRRFQERIEHLSSRDALTGLPNRSWLEDQLDSRIATSQRSRFYQALLCLDLDNFKLINDTLGPRRGDQLLMEVAHSLCETVSDADLVARLGGDEFMIVLSDLCLDPIEAAARVEGVAERILDALSAPFGDADLEHRVTASMGAVLFVGREHSVDELMQQSDIAMYQAKSAGRNTFAFFDPEVRSSLVNRHRIEVELREAIRSDQLVPFFQGQVDGSDQLVGVELLIRWRHPTRGLLSPAEFLPVAEASGLIVDLGYEVLGMAVAQLKRWRRNQRARRLSISVNISAKHFEQHDFVGRVAEIIADNDLHPGTLKLEITESALAQDLDTISARMHALRDLGIAFSLDDFGTGYSSLTYLKRLPIAQVKIDQSFVRDLLVDENDRGITETIIALANTLKMDTVAEGVETEEHRALLRRLGCPVFQGYLFDRPAPLDELCRRYGLPPDPAAED